MRGREGVHCNVNAWILKLSELEPRVRNVQIQRRAHLSHVEQLARRGVREKVFERKRDTAEDLLTVSGC